MQELQSKAINFPIAVVGSRKASGASLRASFEFATLAANQSISVISGLALGCDTAAHLGCLESGGQTIAILPCGINHITPFFNRSLANRILESGGSLVSEYSPETPPLPFRFVERNRTIASLSRAVVVMEAEQRSGTMHTARFALELRKPLACFVPESGRVSSGCRLLLEKHGATPLQNEADLASFLTTLSNTKESNPPSWQGRGEGGWRV